MKATTVIYLDTKGREHEALVFAENPFHPDSISVVYVDESRPDADNIVKVHDVRHMSTISEAQTITDRYGNKVQQGNPGLPTYHLNCWKEYHEVSKALPSDHPVYDHPHRKQFDEDGSFIPVERPIYDAEVAAHLAQNPDAIITPDGKIESASGAAQVAISSGDVTFNAQAGTATSQPPAADAASDAPAPDAANAAGAPSADDLDAVANEQKAAEATAGRDPLRRDPLTN